MNLSTARQIIHGAQTYALTNQLKPLAIVVLDAGGHVIAFERQDGASNMRFQIAQGKAFGALALGIGSRAIMTRAEEQPYFVTSVGHAIGGSLVPVPGGVIALSGDDIIGAVGITGDTSDNDELAAVAGIESVALMAKPD